MDTTPKALVAAWLVHVYTATGVVLAVLIVMAAWEGDVVRALWARARGTGRRRHGRDVGPRS
ncbi:MAG: hypothetical protein ACR2LE_06765 [Nocardioidaceae bacterium]